MGTEYTAIVTVPDGESWITVATVELSKDYDLACEQWDIAPADARSWLQPIESYRMQHSECIGSITRRARPHQVRTMIARVYAPLTWWAHSHRLVLAAVCSIVPPRAWIYLEADQ